MQEAIVVETRFVGVYEVYPRSGVVFVNLGCFIWDCVLTESGFGWDF